MTKYTLSQLEEIKTIIDKARDNLAIVMECQKTLRSKGIDAYITSEGTFTAKVAL